MGVHLQISSGNNIRWGSGILNHTSIQSFLMILVADYRRKVTHVLTHYVRLQKSVHAQFTVDFSIYLIWTLILTDDILITKLDSQI
jgi:hypothetical protein